MRIAPLLLASVGLVVACSSTPEEERTQNAGAPVAVGAACRDIWAGIIGPLGRCAMFRVGSGVEPDFARQAMTHTGERYIARCEHVLAAGRVTETSLAKCLASTECPAPGYDEHLFSLFDDFLFVCSEDARDDGAQCHTGALCKSGYCTAGASACGGTCAPRPPARQAGEPCSRAYPCAAGHNCVTPGGNLPRICTPRIILKEGEICSDPSVRPSPLGQACEESLRCPRSNGSEPTRCAPLVPRGGLCATYSECERGLTCVSNICMPFPGEGEACTAAGMAQSRCAAGLGCDPKQSKCVPIVTVKPGETCDAFYRMCPAGCAANTFTPTSEAICAPSPTVVPDGGECWGGGVCDQFAKCIRGTCKFPTSPCP